MREGVQDFYTLCEISVAIVFGLENPTFLAKSDFGFPKCTEGAGGGRPEPEKYQFLTPSILVAREKEI